MPQRLVSWCPPPSGTLKFNVDGASIGNPGPSGAGGVIRDHKNQIVGFFSLNLGFGGAVEAETEAILFALRFCQQFMLCNVMIESKSLIVVGWVNNNTNTPANLLNELNQIDFLQDEVHCIEIRHIFREANSTADNPPKEGCNRVVNVWNLCVPKP